ncbi:hypothetical protein [Emcibacter nanhaiensis]|uniref:Uncharacterized protein n=1 Tax=Emcibacter nanhaiensis TaxID=1505037 RepID=A0A501PHZ3_9PROT|nr:hypothetical protein [Emcibacter nanhaiensis]TPD59815.1 hypothetical protein FIV46_10005 [Emcibacter nanhaiensis]
MQIKLSTRIVILVADVAIKIPKLPVWKKRFWHYYLEGLRQNRNEIDWWERTHDGRLCPIKTHFLGGQILVMQRATQLTEQQFKEYFPHPSSLEEYFDNSYTYPDCELTTSYMPYEHKSDGFGLLSGKVIALDYGNDDLPNL